MKIRALCVYNSAERMQLNAFILIKISPYYNANLSNLSKEWKISLLYWKVANILWVSKTINVK